MNEQQPAEDDLMSLVRAAVPGQARSVATAQTEAAEEDLSLAETRAELQMALDSEGSGAIDVASPELDSLLADLDQDSASPPRKGSDSDTGSGLIVIANILGNSPSAEPA